MNDGLERRAHRAGSDFLTGRPQIEYRLVNPPKHTRFVSTGPVGERAVYEVPDDRRWYVRWAEALRDAIGDLGFALVLAFGAPVAIGAGWAAVSWVLTGDPFELLPPS